MSKMPISVAIIAMNEEDKIGECLASVAWAEEIVVVDSGSSDRTLEIARRYTDRVFHRDWSGFSDQKNFAMGQCRHRWVLSLDADERVSPELLASLNELRSQVPGEQVGYRLKRRTWYLNRWIFHGDWYPDKKIRLVCKDHAQWVSDQGGLHERLEVAGEVGEIDGDLLHESFSTLEEHVNTIQRFTTLAAQSAVEKGVRAGAVTMIGHAGWAFLRNYLVKNGFKDGIPGLILATLSGFAAFTKYAKIWAYRRASKKATPHEGDQTGASR